VGWSAWAANRRPGTWRPDSDCPKCWLGEQCYRQQCIIAQLRDSGGIVAPAPQRLPILPNSNYGTGRREDGEFLPVLGVGSM